MSTFDAVASAKARDAAIEQVEKAADDAWKAKAAQAVRYVAETRAEFTTDAVWYVLEKLWVVSPPRQPRAMGAIMRNAARARVCETMPKTSKSTRVECHRRPLQVYESLVFKANRA